MRRKREGREERREGGKEGGREGRKERMKGFIEVSFLYLLQRSTEVAC